MDNKRHFYEFETVNENLKVSSWEGGGEHELVSLVHSGSLVHILSRVLGRHIWHSVPSHSYQTTSGLSTLVRPSQAYPEGCS